MERDKIAELTKERDYKKLLYDTIGMKNTSGLSHAERAELSGEYETARARYYKAQADLDLELKELTTHNQSS